jgi:anti-anti-sigma regulatory factor
LPEASARQGASKSAHLSDLIARSAYRRGDLTFEPPVTVTHEHLTTLSAIDEVAQNVAEQIDVLVAQNKPRVLALDMSRVPDIEYSALQALMKGETRATERGAIVWLVGLNPGVLKVVRNAGLADRLGRDRMLFNARAAIERYQALQATANASQHQS